MIVYGKNVIREAVYNNRPIKNLWIDNKFSDQKFLYFLKDRDIKYQLVDKHKLNELTNNAIHQGIVAKVKPYEYYNLEDIIDEARSDQRFIILDGIEDPHNLGAILRTSEAAGIDGVIIPRRNQVQLNSTVAKVSSGSIEHVRVVSVANINNAIIRLKQANIFVIGTDGSATKEYTEINKDVSLAIVLGSEGEGIRPLVKRNCDELVKIPMYGKINSLNVSVAAALLIYAVI